MTVTWWIVAFLRSDELRLIGASRCDNSMEAVYFNVIYISPLHDCLQVSLVLTAV